MHQHKLLKLENLLLFGVFFNFLSLVFEHCYQGRFAILNRDRFITAIHSANLGFSQRKLRIYKFISSWGWSSENQQNVASDKHSFVYIHNDYVFLVLQYLICMTRSLGCLRREEYRRAIQGQAIRNERHCATIPDIAPFSIYIDEFFLNFILQTVFELSRRSKSGTSMDKWYNIWITRVLLIIWEHRARCYFKWYVN